MFLGKGVLKMCNKFTGEHPCGSVISIKLLRNFIETTLWHGCSPVNLLHIFRTPFTKNTSERLLLNSFKKVLVRLQMILWHKLKIGKKQKLGFFRGTFDANLALWS